MKMLGGRGVLGNDAGESWRMVQGGLELVLGIDFSVCNTCAS